MFDLHVLNALNNPGTQYGDTTRYVVSPNMLAIDVSVYTSDNRHIKTFMFPLTKFIKDELDMAATLRDSEDYQEALVRWSVIANMVA